MTGPREETIIKKILNGSEVIAVVGLSDKKGRPSYRVASYLQKHGYKIIPVNPGISEVLGVKSYPDLESVSCGIDVVDIFRKSEDVPAIVESAIAKGARAIWLQEGIANEEAARLAAEAGIDFVMDRCMRKEHGRLGS
ncbi:MAG: CoA-binding protein [Candidatus Zixiibacteriota bacterium]|nr:MAG: CoA-binding protein [candidate division Zixibacteria bacterium]